MAQRPSQTNADSNSVSHHYSHRLLTVGILIAAILFVRSTDAAEEHLKVIASGPHLKDWRFKLCGEYACVDKVVLCAPGYHMVYGNRCVVNMQTMPSWQDEVSGRQGGRRYNRDVGRMSVPSLLSVRDCIHWPREKSIHWELDASRPVWDLYLSRHCFEQNCFCANL